MNINEKLLYPEELTLPDEAYEAFEKDFEELTGIRLELYKEKQMKRRINTLIGRKRLKDYTEFLTLLRSDLGELASFEEYITINVTDFFRTPEQWSDFEEEVLHNLTSRSGAKLKIWSCACSTGEEAYSLAMSFLHVMDASRFQILATDIDEETLRKAEKGCYEEKSMEKVPADLQSRYFTRQGKQWLVSEELRRCVEFRKLDLLQDSYPEDCDLIVCRNVLIYFTEEAKNLLYARFRESLKPGGYLFTGNTEQIIYYKKYGMKKLKNYLYQNP